MENGSLASKLQSLGVLDARQGLQVIYRILDNDKTELAKLIEEEYVKLDAASLAELKQVRTEQCPSDVQEQAASLKQYIEKYDLSACNAEDLTL